MKKMSKILFPMLFIFVLASCAKYTYIDGQDNLAVKEQVSFVQNPVNAKIMWRKKIGTFFQDSAYLVGIGPTLLPDGKIYYQDQKTIWGLDTESGETRVKYEKPDGYMIALDHAFLQSGKTVFPLDSNESARKGLFIINNISGERKTIEYGWCSQFVIPAGSKVIDIPCSNSFSTWFVIRELDSGNIIWELKKIFASFLSLDVKADTVAILYQKNYLFFIEAYNLNTGELLWSTQIKPKETKGWLKELRGLKELFVTEYYVEKDDFDGNVISMDFRKGEINWQMSDVIRIDTKRYGGEDDLFYLYKKTLPEIVYGIDQESGKERLILTLKGRHPVHGFISTPDKIFYPGISGMVNYQVVQYNAFAAVDKATGRNLWTLDSENQTALPLYDNNILYFGNRDEAERYYSGSLQGYKMIYGLYRKEDKQKFLSKTAFAANAETGQILWKVKLEGGDAPYVEKILVKNNMAFIKSLSGWLYAIEWEKSSKLNN